MNGMYNITKTMANICQCVLCVHFVCTLHNVCHWIFSNKNVFIFCMPIFLLIGSLFRAIYYRNCNIRFVRCSMQILCIVIGASASAIDIFVTALYIYKICTLDINDAVNVICPFTRSFALGCLHWQKRFQLDCMSICERAECKRSPWDTSHC